MGPGVRTILKRRLRIKPMVGSSAQVQCGEPSQRQGQLDQGTDRNELVDLTQQISGEGGILMCGIGQFRIAR